MGVRWQLMLPVQPFKGRYQRPDLRNHRKILVVDGEVGFMGSQNIIDRSYNKRGNIRRGLKWKELVVRVEGPIVSGLEAIFIDRLVPRDRRGADARDRAARAGRRRRRTSTARWCRAVPGTTTRTT